MAESHVQHKLLGMAKRRIPTLIAVITLLVVWEAWVRLGHVPSTMIAAPSEIAQATVETWPTLWPATEVTLLEGTVGFLFAVTCGILIGILLYCSRIADAALFPLLSAAQTMPLISIAPLFLIWFGFEISGKIVIVAVFGLFPIAVQTVRGLEAVPQFYSDVALTCGATRAWTLWHVKLRVAARQIYGGIRVSAAYIFATATTAEYLGARKGLGIWLQAAYNSFRTPLIFSATSGAKLIEDDAIAALTSKLFPLATVITPNMPETQVLCDLAVEQGAGAIDYENGESISTENDMVTAGHLLAGHFGCAVLVKGGHGTHDASDVLVEPDGKITWFRSRRINNPNTHGTGCTLSSAIASHLALGEALPTAVDHAKLYLTGALEAQLDLGHGSGPMDHAWKWR